jgi:hypothetical protein
VAFIIERTGKINQLQIGQYPRERFHVARFKHHGHNSPDKAILPQRVHQLPFHPDRLFIDGVRRKQSKEPIASPKGLPDFIVPLLGTFDVRFAIHHTGTP